MIDIRPGWLALLVLVGCSGCSKRGAPSDVARGSAEPALPPAAEPRCKLAAPGAHFAVGVTGAPTDASAEEQEPEQFLPFSVEVGAATVTRAGFAVGALRSEAEGTHALLVLVSERAERGRSVDLGRVYGDVEPPVVASRGSTTIVSIADSNPNGRRLRLAKLDTSGPDAAVVRGAELEPGRGFQTQTIEVGGTHALVAWDQQLPKSDQHGIFGASVDLVSFGASEPRRLGGEDVVAEWPRLVRRPAGFWLVFLEPLPGDASAAARSVPEGESESLVDLGARGLAVIGLDEQGNATGAKRRVTQPGAHVLSFDAVETVSGGLVLAWRDDPAGLGAERGRVHGAIVGPDGSISTHAVEAEEAGAGTPSLLAADRLWLALGGLGEATRLGTVDVGARQIEPPSVESVLRGADVLAGSGSRLLLAQPRGMGVEFSVAECSPRPRSP